MHKFWQDTALEDMTPEQWESLCDGCGKCCRMQFVDQEAQILMQTDVACYLLDTETIKCSDYANRQSLVPDCVQITPQNIEQLFWLPDTCGYRRVQSGRDLPKWHHLNCNNSQAVHQHGFSIKGKVISENLVDENEFTDRIISWIPIND